MAHGAVAPRRRVAWLARMLARVGAVAAIFLVVSIWQTRDVPTGRAPDFVTSLASGGEFRLNNWLDRQQDGPVLIYFWAPWCPICGAVAPSVDAVAADWPVLTVAMRYGELKAVHAVLDQRAAPWTTALDPDGEIARRYGVGAVPAFIVLDRRGQVRYSQLGFTTEIGLRARLAWLRLTAS